MLSADSHHLRPKGAAGRSSGGDVDGADGDELYDLASQGVVVVDHRLAASCACLPQAGWAGAEPYLTRASVCLTLPWEL
jgi:hypothetical protein